MDKIEELRNALVIDGTGIGIWDWNVQTGETYFNERWAEIIGYQLEELQPVSIDTWMKYAHPEDLQESNLLLEAHFKGESDYYDFQSRMKHKSGAWVWVHDRGKVVKWDDNGQPLRMCGSHIDITEMKTLEMSLKQALNEKEILLREVHHRVKNNLQFILSFVGLKADPDQRISTIELQNSLRTIAAAHEAVYQSDNFQEISLCDYVKRIVGPFAANNKAHIVLEIDDLRLAIGRLIPIGMIINECITNSLKHAFGDSKPKDNLILVRAGERRGALQLEVHDNGKGFTPDELAGKTNGTGLAIVGGLAKQIDAELEIGTENGARVSISLSSEEAKPQTHAD